MREQILSFYPKLAERIQSGEREKYAIRSVVSDMYRRHEDRIKTTIVEGEEECSTADHAFSALARYMHYPHLGKRTYTAVPTLLPFSPLGKNLFYFSVAGTIAGQKWGPLRLVAIAIHEISHFIFCEQLDVWMSKSGLALPDAATHYFKESLTAAVMNQPEFRSFFDYSTLFGSEWYPGNRELRHLMIRREGKVENIIPFFEDEIICCPQGYLVGLDRMLGKFADAASVFSEKWTLWNELSCTTRPKETIEGEYEQSILLN